MPETTSALHRLASPSGGDLTFSANDSRNFNTPQSRAQVGATDAGLAIPAMPLREYGKVLEYYSANLDSRVRVYREMQSGRTNVTILICSEHGCTRRTETLGAPKADLLGELRDFRQRLSEPRDGRFSSATEQALRMLTPRAT